VPANNANEESLEAEVAKDKSRRKKAGRKLVKKVAKSVAKRIHSVIMGLSNPEKAQLEKEQL